MKFENFRELLLKKSADSKLENIIKFVRDDVLADIMIESLEKMARAKHKGDSANFALRDFGLEMDHEHEPNMIHDALSHHASRYKSALSNERPELANAHAKQIFKIVDMADQAQKHSHGKLDIQAVSPHPWERQAKTDVLTEEDAPVRRGNKKAGQFRTDTKGWRYRGKDYSFLQGAPHESYGNEVSKHGHLGAYPLEHIRVNGKYLHIEDVPKEDLKGFEKHQFDHHPVMEHYSVPASKRTPDHDEKYMKAKDDYHDSRHMQSYFDRHEALESQDPEAYAQRGSKVSDPVHAPVDELKIGEKKEEQPAAVSGSKETPRTDSAVDHIMNSDIPDDIKQQVLRAMGKDGGK